MRKATNVLLVLMLAGLALRVALAAALPTNLDGYWNWTRLNADKLLTNSAGVHPNPKDVYVNIKADQLVDDAGKFKPFPDGTIVVKERFDPPIMAVGRVYFMEKVKGEWTWGFYDRQQDGSYKGGKLENAGICINCHTNAKATEWVFTPYQKR